jgi:CHAT domain-containing protein
MRQAFDGGGMFMPIIPDRPFDVSMQDVYELGRELMPFVDELRTADLVCVFPHGALHSFPFAAVPLADGSPLIEHAAVTVCPSRRTLRVARAAGRSSPEQPFFPRSALAVGVPAADEPNPDAFLGEAGFFESLKVLDEVRGLETSGDATVEEVVGRFGSYDLAHFNCHGHFSRGAALDSCLMLSDGRSGPRLAAGVTARDAGNLDARSIMQRCRAGTDVVVLRACSSGVTNVRAGDEQEGILRALIHVGTATCLVARWKIDAASSRELLRRFYHAWLIDRLPRAWALQRAQQSFLVDSREYLKHPFHWAPFVIVGDFW